MRKLSNEELDRLTVDQFRQTRKIPVSLVLDNVRSQNNVGSIFRTADAFRVEKIWLCGITPVPPHREIHKTALGATESVDWEYCEQAAQAVEDLRGRGYRLLAVEQAEGSVSPDLWKPDPDSRLGLVFGHEIRGVDQKVVNRCDGCLEIPQHGTKHSLNIAVAAGIVLWEISRHFLQ